MGYLTKYDLENIIPKLTKEEYRDILEFLCQKITGESSRINDRIECYLGESMKWYKFDEKLLK